MSMTIASQDPLYALYVANFDHGAEVLGYEDWSRAVDEAEQAALSKSCVLAGIWKPIGWMQTWPELYTYSHYEQLSLVVFRGFAAVLKEGDLTGTAYEAALVCGRPLLKERLMLPTAEVKEQLLGLMDVTHFGPPLELTPERLAVLRSVLRVVLIAEDWRAIALATAAQVEQQVMAIVA
jgi:hypothetical protein